MAFRLVLASRLLLFCFAEVFADLLTWVSSDLKNGEEMPHISQLVVRGSNRRLMQDIDCDGLCKQRCSVYKGMRHVLCKMQVCAARHLRDTQLCGTCYTDMTTHRNITKCP